MRKIIMSKWIIYCCFGIWIITTALQVYYPHPYRGLIGNSIMFVGILVSFIQAKRKKLKSPLYSPSRFKHVLNWVVLIFSIIITITFVGFIYSK